MDNCKYIWKYFIKSFVKDKEFVCTLCVFFLDCWTAAFYLRRHKLTQTYFVVYTGSNILLARMATRKAKPDGQYHLKPEEVDDFIRGQLVTSLPGTPFFWRTFCLLILKQFQLQICVLDQTRLDAIPWLWSENRRYTDFWKFLKFLKIISVTFLYLWEASFVVKNFMDSHSMIYRRNSEFSMLCNLISFNKII